MRKTYSDKQFFLYIFLFLDKHKLSSYEFKWLTSHIFYELFGCRDIGMQVGNMDMNEDKREEETILH